MLALAQWLEHTSVSQEIQKALWLIPLLQTTHIIAIAMALSSVLMIDLRILGFGKSLTMTQTSARHAPWPRRSADAPCPRATRTRRDAS